MNIEERIDRYLLGQMSEQERKSFEDDLLCDESLKQEYEAAALVASSVCSNKVKGIMKQAEEEYQMELEERIDRYILGRMTPEEASEFESDLKEDISLREDYEAQKQVASAVQRQQFKAIMKQAESELEEQTGHESIFKRIFGNIEIKFEIPAVRRTVYAFAVAASLAVVSCIGYDLEQGNAYRNSAEGLMAELVQPRGGSDIDDMLYAACTKISGGDPKGAIADIDEAVTMIDSELKELDLTTEEGQYDQQMLRIQREDAEWFKAVSLMKQGKHRQAKKQLKSIISSGSRHAEEAARILEKNRLF